MKKILASLLLCLSAHASADTIATLPNKAGGKIVLTDEVCAPNSRERYDSLWRAYNYGSSGGTSDGCWLAEDETIVVIWINADNSRTKSRYPIVNFILNPNFSKNKRNTY